MVSNASETALVAQASSKVEHQLNATLRNPSTRKQQVHFSTHHTATMARSAVTPTLYQEVQLSTSPASPASVLTINTTSSNSSAVALFSAGRKRAYNNFSELDEETYARKHLASEASVFFRRKSRTPRSFLWRVLDDRRLLEVQCVDLIQERGDSQTEGSLTFHIELPAEIVKGGVAFADPEETDALEVFVLTTGNDLFTITLKKDLLARDVPPSEFDPVTVVKKYAPSSFGFRYPYRMIAVNSLEILVSLHDGSLLRLERQANETAAQWRETFYSEGGWGGTLKALNPLKRRQTVRYGDLDLETSSAVDLAKSPDGNFVWTITLDHQLKAWSANTGRVALQMDLLQEKGNRDGSRRHTQYVMTAEQGKLLQVARTTQNADDETLARMDEDGSYYVWVHSPKDHQFKVYEVRPSSSLVNGETLRCEDLQPRATLIPPIEEMLNTNIWHLEEFHAQPSPTWKETQLWIRARSGAFCKTFALSFDMLEDDQEIVTKAFRTGWTVVDNGPSTPERLREATDFPAQLSTNTDSLITPTERWMSFLFSPGRFSASSIEAALHTYCKRRKLPIMMAKESNVHQASLQERLIASVTSQTILARSANNQPDYDGYQADIAAQWTGFYSILEELHRKRVASVSLALDVDYAQPWLVGTDSVAPVRANDELELICLNTALLEDEEMTRIAPQIAQSIYNANDVMAQPTAYLMAAAHNFRRSLPADTQDIFKQIAYQDALWRTDPNDRNSSEDDRAGLQGLYERCDLGNEVSEEIFGALEADVHALEGLGSIDRKIFQSVLLRLDNTRPSPEKVQNLELCRYGERLNVTVAQQSLRRNEIILLDLLALISFMSVDLEPSELHPDFAPRKLYNEIIELLKQTRLRLWLARHTRMEPSQDGSPAMIEATLLESFFAGDWKRSADAADDDDMPRALTRWSKCWAYAVDLKKDWTAATSHVFSMLLQSELYNLASDFVKFMPDTPWSIYMQARLDVALGEYDMAAVRFHEAANDRNGVARHERQSISVVDTAELLSTEEQTFFRSGLSQYYQHVVAVFQKPGVFSYVADFAAEALKNVHGIASLDDDLARIDGRKSITDSPAMDRIDDTMKEIKLIKIRDTRSDIASHLFSALVKTGRFREAYDALQKCNEDLRKANLKLLVETCIKQDSVPALLALPFSPELAADADATLLVLAKKSLASTSSATKPHHQILYAFRSQRGDFRGAAEILYEHLERLRQSESRAYQDPEDETTLQAYLLLINTLACCGEGEGWLLAEPIAGVHQAGQKRKLVTLEEVRRDYAAELDRRSDILQGRFPLVGEADEMDVF
jgi:hypothetical protein